MDEMTEVVNGMSEIFKITSKLKVILDNTKVTQSAYSKILNNTVIEEVKKIF